MSGHLLSWLPLPRALASDPRWLCLSPEALRVALLLLLRADDSGAVALVGHTAAYVLDAVVGEGAATHLDELVDGGVLRVERRRLVLPDVVAWRASCTPGRADPAPGPQAEPQPVRRGPPSASREAARERKRRSRNRKPVTTPGHEAVTTPAADVTTCHEAGHEAGHEAVTTQPGGGRGGEDSEKEPEKIKSESETGGARADVTTPGHEPVTTPPAVAPATSGAPPTHSTAKGKTRRKHAEQEELPDLVPPPGTRERTLYDRVVQSPVFGQQAALGGKLRIQAPGRWVADLFASPTYAVLDVTACVLRALSWGEDPANRSTIRSRGSGRAFVERWLDRDAARARDQGAATPPPSTTPTLPALDDERARSAARAAEYQRKQRDAEERRRKMEEING